jgi:hypothetical protein
MSCDLVLERGGEASRRESLGLALLGMSVKLILRLIECRRSSVAPDASRKRVPRRAHSFPMVIEIRSTMLRVILRRLRS